MTMKRVGLFGGSFNPPHLGHTRSAAEAARQLGLDMLIFMPTGKPPHKDIANDSPASETRLELVRLATCHIKGAAVMDYEIKRNQVSYTYDTVRELMSIYPGCELWILMGSDMFLYFPNWYRADWLLKNTSLAVFPRTDDLKEILTYAEKLQSEGANVRIINEQPLVISSTSIRMLLAQRKGREYLSDIVYSYIIKNRLYGALPDFDWLRRKVDMMMEPDRRAHVRGTENTAAELAVRWGVSEEDARTAAILHDCTKRRGRSEQLNILKKYGTMSNISKMTENVLLHSETAACIAASRFGVSNEIADAIRYHTTGRAGMKVLEKVIYIADYIEPARQFPGVQTVRDLAFYDLDAAMIQALENTLSEIKKRGIEPDKRTEDALADLRRGHVL